MNNEELHRSVEEKMDFLKELLEVKTTHIMAENRMFFDDVRKGQKDMLDKQDITNSRVNKLEEIEEGNRPYMDSLKWIKKNALLLISFSIVVLFGLMSAYHRVDVEHTLQHKFGIVVQNDSIK